MSCAIGFIIYAVLMCVIARRSPTDENLPYE